MSGIGNLAVSYRDPGDYALRQWEEQGARLWASDAVVNSDLIGRVANVLTEELNGYRARALKAAIIDALDAVLDADVADLKAAEQAQQAARLAAIREARP